MANIKNMGMAETILSNGNIQVKKGFFGLTTSYTYAPTGSKMKAEQMGFDVSNGELVRKMLNGDLEYVKSELKKNGLPTTAGNANTELNIFYAEDHQFVAMQVEQYKDFTYRPVTDVIIGNGDDAKEILKSLGI